jgi:hypothetical protein
MLIDNSKFLYFRLNIDLEKERNSKNVNKKS